MQAWKKASLTKSSRSDKCCSGWVRPCQQEVRRPWQPLCSGSWKACRRDAHSCPPVPLSPSRAQPERPPGATGDLPRATSSACPLQLFLLLPLALGFPDSSIGKGSACNAGDPGSVLRSGRSAGEGTGYALQYSWASLVAQLGKNVPKVKGNTTRSGF